LELLRINQFESKFQAMSVLVRDVASNKHYIFVKGAPEKIQRISNNKVTDFDKILSDVSLGGLRCLGIAFR
jgi:magnesium-transporting ATPase (P-type)